MCLGDTGGVRLLCTLVASVVLNEFIQCPVYLRSIYEVLGASGDTFCGATPGVPSELSKKTKKSHYLLGAAVRSPFLTSVPNLLSSLERNPLTWKERALSVIRVDVTGMLDNVGAKDEKILKTKY